LFGGDGEQGTKTKAVEGAVQALHRHIQSDEHRKLVSADIDRQVGTLKTEVEYLRGKFLGHIDRMEKTNHQANRLLEEAQKTQRMATGAFEKTKREVVVSRRGLLGLCRLSHCGRLGECKRRFYLLRLC